MKLLCFTQWSMISVSVIFLSQVFDCTNNDFFCSALFKVWTEPGDLRSNALKLCINPFYANVLCIYPIKMSGSIDYGAFSGSIDMER